MRKEHEEDESLVLPFTVSEQALLCSCIYICADFKLSQWYADKPTWPKRKRKKRPDLSFLPISLMRKCLWPLFNYKQYNRVTEFCI